MGSTVKVAESATRADRQKHEIMQSLLELNGELRAAKRQLSSIAGAHRRPQNLFAWFRLWIRA